MNRARVSTVAILVIAGACHHHASPPPGTPVNPDLHPLNAIVGQPLILAPVQSMRVAPELAWTGLPKTAGILAALDSALTDTLKARVENQQWVFADGLVQSARNNPTYATDPHALAVQSLRSPKLEIATRLPEPLATQVRTMIALHEGRLVLIPVELRFERTPTGLARPIIHFVLVDPRLSDVRWVGDVAGLELPTFAGTFVGPMAARVADLFIAK